MTNGKIEPGDKFGEWTVISFARRDSKSTYWNCRCSCGTEKEVRQTILKNGTSTRCRACADKARRTINIGDKFGRLTVIDKKPKSNCWICQCDCGTITEQYANSLTTGRVISCGCYHRERIGNQNKKPIEIGTKFGELTVIKELGSSDRGLLYLVRCSCGKEYEIAGCRLREGRISCGHLSSKAEYIITNILKDKKIIFIPQWDRDDFRLSSGRKCRFDFAIFKNKNDETPTFFIEYNGQQHYLFYNSGWNTEENYNLTIQRDAEKAALCKQHNIPLEVIPYTEFDNLESIITSLLNKYETHTIE